ncbi:hypothetical protein KIW84_063808 [Lathyrus oleraceus]|uniref:Uncharacterized protein n=1 Tax=Pisum sativum TaxID=3888 RepID=A0A9D5A870_PEA|nr:hypothetical protein KIW84_063808 [Pisum sativum]
MRFGLEFDLPMEELKKLVQTGSLEAYQESVDNLVCRTTLTEYQKLQCYLGGLQQELCNGMKMFTPRMVLEATRMAKLRNFPLKKWMNIWLKTYVFSVMTNSFLDMIALRGKKMQVFLMEVGEEDHLDLTEVDSVSEGMSNDPTHIVEPTVSLNAIQGDSSHPTIRLIG